MSGPILALTIGVVGGLLIAAVALVVERLRGRSS